MILVVYKYSFFTFYLFRMSFYSSIGVVFLFVNDVK